jgi:hypothetical protein
MEQRVVEELVVVAVMAVTADDGRARNELAIRRAATATAMAKATGPRRNEAR